MAAAKLRLLSLLVFVISPPILLLLFLPLLAHPIVKFGECLQDGRSPREEHHQAERGQEEEDFSNRERQASLQQLRHLDLERLGKAFEHAQRWRLGPRLDLRNVNPVNLDLFRKAFLGQPPFLP